MKQAAPSAPVEAITTTAKVKDVTKIPIRQRTKKPVAGILYAPTSTVTEQSKETAGYKYTKAVPIATSLQSESSSTITTTRYTLPPVESSSTTLLASSSSSSFPPSSSTYKASSLPPSNPTSGYSYKPSSQPPLAQTSGYSYKPSSQQPQTNGYSYNKSSSPRAAITLGYQKQSPLTTVTSTSSSTTSRRLVAGKGYRHNSNTVNKSVLNVSNEPQTTQTAVTKKIHRGRGGYKYKIPEGIKPTDDGYVYNKVIKRQ